LAYTVGSASVDIVPDFKNAQLAITRFFNSKPDTYKIPVHLDIQETDSSRVEQQAERAGSRISEAMSRGAAKNDAAATRMAERAARERERVLNFAHGEALRMQAQMDKEAARNREQTEKASLAAINQAHAEALRINAQMDREAVRQQTATMKAITEAAEGAARERQRIMDEERDFAVRSARATMEVIEKVTADQEALRLKIEVDERNAIMEGRRTGGLITRAVQQEIHQNAGLIAATIAGVLALGAPAALAGATVLFGGIGAVAAFQNDQLRASWVGLWNEIKSGAVSDAGILVPTFDRMATSIGQSFQRLRPQMRDTFTELAPQIDTFTASLTRMAENALPGIFRAVQNGMPFMQGFGDFMERTGTGISAFFDRISAHAPAAGQTMRELGSSFEALLPALGELLGEGAELASVTLPVLTGSLRGLLTVLDAVGGTLPMIGAGFLAFRAVQGTGRLITGWSQSLLTAAENGGVFANAMSRSGTALATVGRAAPAVGIAMALYAAAAADSTQRTNEWTTALNEGGAAARRARDEMRGQAAVLNEAQSGLSGFAIAASGASSAVGIYADDVDNAERAQRDYLASLTPLESAQRQLDIATRNLQEVMGDENATAAELAEAKARVARAADNQARAEDDLARATKGVTEAMAEQANAARARVDAAFGYQQAVLDTAQAQADYQAALNDTEATAGEVEQALLDLNQAYADQVTRAGELAMSNLPASMDDTQRSIIGAAAELKELNALMASGVVLPPSLEQYRQQLLSIVSGADGAALAQAQLTAALGEVGASVSAIPDSKAVIITSPTTPEVLAKLQELGFTVTTLPDGTVRVEPKTQQAMDALGDLASSLAGLGITVAKPTVSLIDSPYQTIAGSVLGSLFNLGRQNPRPTVTGIDQASGIIGTILGNLGNVGRQNPRPTVSAIDAASAVIGAVQRGLGAIQSKSVTVSVNYREVNRPVTGAFAATGGAVEDVLARAPRYDGGGATYGIGGPTDDLNIIRVSPGEHVFDARDVDLMGGQAAVYAFREMLNSGAFRTPRADTGVRQMVTMGAPRLPAQPQPSTRDVRIFTSDNPKAIIRAMRAEQQQAEALAPVWP